MTLQKTGNQQNTELTTDTQSKLTELQTLIQEGTIQTTKEERFWTKLKTTDLTDMHMFVVEYRSYTSIVKRYYLGRYENICKAFWVEYTPLMTEEDMCTSIIQKMRYKGVATAHNARFMHPIEGFIEHKQIQAEAQKTNLTDIDYDPALIALNYPAKPKHKKKKKK